MENFLDVNQYLFLPNGPGVYQFHNNTGKIIYVGKAKNLKKRVSSYFSKKHTENKTKTLVNAIKKISYTVVENEIDALLLENNFIKYHQPKYNILLKDDKTYPWIKITNEVFPRIISTRTFAKDGADYFGPFTNVKAMNLMIELLHDLFQIRSCKLNLIESQIEKGKFSECLDFHLKKCNAPCIGNQTHQNYTEAIHKAKNLLKGEFSKTRKELKDSMERCSAEYNYESAELIKKLLQKLDAFQTKSSVVFGSDLNCDVFVWQIVDEIIFSHYMILREGAIINSISKANEIKISEYKNESLLTILFDFIQLFRSENDLILSNSSFEVFGSKLNLQNPSRGSKKILVDLALKNLTYFRLQNKRKTSDSKTDFESEMIVESIQNELNLDVCPTHIECFDNSNFQGTNAVSACVVFKMGKPKTNEYRHFNIKTVDGPDDFMSMKEVVHRRYERLRNEKKELPQLVVIDGGKGQLNAAYIAIKDLGLLKEIQLIGLAKKKEEIFFPGIQNPTILDRRSIALKIIQQLRNEAHRFSLKHHRNKRSKSSSSSELDTITGIGQKTKEKLLRKFKSFQNIKEAKEIDIESLVGKSKSKIILNYIKSLDD